MKARIKETNEIINVEPIQYGSDTVTNYWDWELELIEDGRQAMIEKACEWLKENCIGFVMTKDEISDFREYMEA